MVQTEFLSSLPSPCKIKSLLPLSIKNREFLESSRKRAQAIVERTDPSLAIILGPCSIHNVPQALEYAQKIKAKSLELSSMVLMRVFFEKPRTTVGWKGFIYDPDLNGSNDIEKGIYLARELLLNLVDLKVPIATEFVDPILAPYIEDLIVWGFIGARTSFSQPHRQLASSLPYPIGMKNSPDGDLLSAIYGVVAARSAHTFPALNEEGKIGVKKSYGNPHAHIVLRGSSFSPNYSPESVQKALKLIEYNGIHSKILVDCAHGNSQKETLQQEEAFKSVLEQYANGNKALIGVMLESNLHEGNQVINEASQLSYGVSVTDPCMGWSKTEGLLSTVEAFLSTSSPVF